MLINVIATKSHVIILRTTSQGKTYPNFTVSFHRMYVQCPLPWKNTGTSRKHSKTKSLGDVGRRLDRPLSVRLLVKTDFGKFLCLQKGAENHISTKRTPQFSFQDAEINMMVPSELLRLRVEYDYVMYFCQWNEQSWKMEDPALFAWCCPWSKLHRPRWTWKHGGDIKSDMFTPRFANPKAL